MTNLYNLDNLLNAKPNIFEGAAFYSQANSTAINPFQATASLTAQTDIEKANQIPASGKAIPIVFGAARPQGEIIWAHTYLNATNECRANVAVCFGQNIFRRPLLLGKVEQGASTIYDRTGGAVIDPPNAVRFYDGTHEIKDPLIVSIEGDSNTPAYKGYIYAVLENIKLGDAFYATATDNGIYATTEKCDPFHDLDGIDLKADSNTGLLYGLKNPGTSYAEIVTTDGCTIFNSVPIENNLIFANIGYYEPIFLPDNVVPISCTPYVALTGYHSEAFNLNGPHGTHTLSYFSAPLTFLCDPITGKLQFPAGLRQDTAVYQGYGVAANVLAPPAQTDPAAGSLQPSGVDFKISYRLPGYPNLIIALRKFDRDNNWFTSVAGFASNYNEETGVYTNIGTYSLSGVGNMTGVIIDLNTGLPVIFGHNYGYDYDHRVIYENGNPLWPSMDMAVTNDKWLLRIDPLSSPPFTFAIGCNQFNLSNFPDVDDIIFCRDSFSAVYLAGYKQSGSDIKVYFIAHDPGGIFVRSTATISNHQCTGITYDKIKMSIVVSATIFGPTPFESVVYYVSEGGSVTAVYSAPPQSHVVSAYAGAVSLLSNTGGYITTINTATGATTTSAGHSNLTGAPIVDTLRGNVYLPTTDGLVTQGINSVNPGDIPIQSLLTDLCTYKGYQESDLNFFGISNIFAKGMLINQTSKITDLINRLSTIYGFTFAETDGLLKFSKRRNSSGLVGIDHDLTADDLVERQGNNGISLVDSQRTGPDRLVTAMDFQYLDIDRNFEATTQILNRPLSLFPSDRTANKQSLSVPLSLSFASARALLYEAFYSLLENETRFAFTVPSWHMRIEPGDIVRVSIDGNAEIGQVTRVTLRPDFGQDVECSSFLANGSTVVGTQPTGTPSNPSAGFGQYVHLNIPLLASGDTTPPTEVRNYFALTTRAIENWTGADLYRSWDNLNYEKILQYEAQPATVAVAKNILLPPDLPFATDYKNKLTLAVRSGNEADFKNVSRDEALSKLTLAAYGREGAWEIISWEVAFKGQAPKPRLGTLRLAGADMAIARTGTTLLQPPQGSLLIKGVKINSVVSGSPGIEVLPGTLRLIGNPQVSKGILPGNYVGNNDGLITLSNLQRGLFGTHTLSDIHANGDLIVVLDPAKINSFRTGKIFFNADFRVATAQKPLAESIRTPAFIDAVDKQPYQPSLFKVTHLAGSSDLNISWVPCTTLGNEWVNDFNVSAVLAEPESYSGKIYYGSLTFSFNTTNRNYTWTGYGAALGASNPVDDTGNLVTVELWQNSSVWVGGGSSIVTNAVEN